MNIFMSFLFQIFAFIVLFLAAVAKQKGMIKNKDYWFFFVVAIFSSFAGYIVIE